MQDSQGSTALMGACLVGHCSIVGALLKARVPPPSTRTMRRSHQLRGRRTRFCPRHPTLAAGH